MINLFAFGWRVFHLIIWSSFFIASDTFKINDTVSRFFSACFRSSLILAVWALSDSVISLGLLFDYGQF